MNGFTKLLVWAAILILGWIGLKMAIGTVFGLVGLLWQLVAFVITAAILLGIVSLIRVLYRKTQR